MGNLASSLKFFSLYDLIAERKDKYFGHIRVLRCKANNTNYIMKQIQGTSQQLQQLEEQLQQKILIQNDFIMNVKDFKLIDEEIHVLMDQWHSNFASQYEDRRTKKIYLQEEMLLDMLFKIVNGLADLQKKKIAYDIISPYNLFIQERLGKQNVYKTGDPILFLNTNLAKLFSSSDPADRQYIYVSPEQMKGLELNNINHPHNRFKSGIFSLGICFIQLAGLQQCDDIYDYDSYQINHQTLQKQLSQLRQNYSQDFINLLNKMICLNVDERPDFLQFRSMKITNQYDTYILGSEVQRQDEVQYEDEPSPEKELQFEELQANQTNKSPSINHQKYQAQYDQSNIVISKYQNPITNPQFKVESPIVSDQVIYYEKEPIGYQKSTLSGTKDYYFQKDYGKIDKTFNGIVISPDRLIRVGNQDLIYVNNSPKNRYNRESMELYYLEQRRLDRMRTEELQRNLDVQYLQMKYANDPPTYIPNKSPLKLTPTKTYSRSRFSPDQNKISLKPLNFSNQESPDIKFNKSKWQAEKISQKYNFDTVQQDIDAVKNHEYQQYNKLMESYNNQFKRELSPMSQSKVKQSSPSLFKDIWLKHVDDIKKSSEKKIEIHIK